MPIQLEQIQDYQFNVSFGVATMPDLLVDEPEPLGAGRGPNPSRLLATAAADCLCASLLFCLRKSRLEPGKIRAVANAETIRNEKGRLRIGSLDVVIDVSHLDDPDGRFGRCAEIFEDFCVVTATLRQAMKVNVTVRLDGQVVRVSE